MNIKHIMDIANAQRSVDVAAQLLEDLDTTSMTFINALGGGGRSSRSPDDRFVNLVSKRDQLRERLLGVCEEYLQVMQWGLEELESVTDEKMRKILYLRFVKEEQWSKIALEIGGKATSDSLKKGVERFLVQSRQDNLGY